MTRDVSLAEIEAALQHLSPWRFSAVLEQNYAVLRARQDRRRFTRTLIVTGVAVLLAIGLDWGNARNLFTFGLPWRLAAAAMCFAATAYIVLRSGPRMAELLYCACLLVVMLTTELIGSVAPPGLQDRYTVAALLIFFFSLAGTPPSLRFAVTTSLLGVLLFPAVVAVCISSDLTQIGSAFAFALATAVITLLLIRRNEITRRRSHLETLRYELAAVELQLMNAELLRTSTTDALTGLVNRRHFESEAGRIWNSTRNEPVGAVLVDVDHFKLYNDSAGHLAGDHCLRLVAQALAGALRKDDCRNRPLRRRGVRRTGAPNHPGRPGQPRRASAPIGGRPPSGPSRDIWRVRQRQRGAGLARAGRGGWQCRDAAAKGRPGALRGQECWEELRCLGVSGFVAEGKEGSSPFSRKRTKKLLL